MAPDPIDASCAAASSAWMLNSSLETKSWPPMLRRSGLRARRAGAWAVALLVFAGFVPQPPPLSGLALAADDIVVAAVATRSGGQLSGGGDVIGAISAYIEETKARGLIARPVRVIAYQEDCSAASAEAVAGQIVARGAHVVIGHMCSVAAIAAAPIYARHGITMITPGARSPRLTDQRAGPGIFRLTGRDDRFGAETAALVGTRFAARRIAIVNDLSVQARTLADAVVRELEARGISPVLRATYIAGEREYKTVIDKLAAAEADVIVIPAQPVEAAIIVDGMRARNMHATLIGSEILAVPEMEPAARRLGDTLIVMLPSATSRAAPEGAHPTRADGPARPPRQTKSPVPLGTRSPGFSAGNSLAAIEAWAFAVERAGSLDITAVTRILETEHAPTCLGPIRFDVKGDAVLASYAPHVWRSTLPDQKSDAATPGTWQALED